MIGDFPLQFSIYTNCPLHHVFSAWETCVYTNKKTAQQWIYSLLVWKLILVTRDDVVSQRLKFGSAFPSCSWESKNALFFNFSVSRARPEKIVWFLLAATSNRPSIKNDMYTASANIKPRVSFILRRGTKVGVTQAAFRLGAPALCPRTILDGH